MRGGQLSNSVGAGGAPAQTNPGSAGDFFSFIFSFYNQEITWNIWSIYNQETTWNIFSSYNQEMCRDIFIIWYIMSNTMCVYQ